MQKFASKNIYGSAKKPDVKKVERTSRIISAYDRTQTKCQLIQTN